MINTDRMRKHIEELIKIPSHDSSGEIASYVERQLRAYGIRSKVLDQYDSSVLAHLGPRGATEILLESHLDTCPPKKEFPFRPVTNGQRLHGLGASDNKASVALALELAASLSQVELSKRVTLLFSGKEEGVSREENPVRHMLQRGLIRPSAAIVLEPTCSEESPSLGICIGCFGLYRRTVEILGIQGHAAWPSRATNAIELAMEFQRLFTERFKSFVTVVHETSALGRPIECVGLANITEISAVDGPGVIPGLCSLTLDFRIPPMATDPDEASAKHDECVTAIETTLGEIFDRIEARWRRRPRSRALSNYPGYIGNDPPFLSGFVKADHPDFRVIPEVAPGRSEGNVLQGEFKIPTIVTGPGVMTQCHAKDEYVDVELSGRASQAILTVLEDECRARPAVERRRRQSVARPVEKLQ